MESLVERLGHRAGARLVLISADRIGTTHSSTAGGFQALRDGAATTGTVVMPAAWARHAAELYRGEDLGVHLTLNSELDCFRWGPITNAPSLLDGDGGFPRTLQDLWDHADLDEVRRESRAQIERAVLWGFDVTHLSTHMAAMQQRPEFFDVLLDLAAAFDLPLRLESGEAERNAGFPFRALATARGVVFPDHFRLVRGDARNHVVEQLADLQPGVTELSLCPALDEPEIHAIDPAAAGRVDDLALALSAELAEMLEESGAVPVGYRALRSAQRRARHRI
ncbi:MAG: ChbG/HpnK family deacetylase [Acidimicrobiaceae bacterium]|nr:ChbG/HpnK family deacetylase [Acidimicrobiaceae bacterium]MCY4174944.1 ChbG/HpnK family deacetylase [Acidimicrobiaceae bacterium]MCY4279503.1 ChbG/HpnK family deacetylase [Acidimicrobiaceae bacterium]MCY4294473.1 ChbG/HpnK family deacetylase [Acidimicrobiaceae bacterium]